MKVCKNCNNIVDDSAKFCNKCGSAFEEAGGGNPADNRQYANNYQGQSQVNIDLSNYFAWFKKRLTNQNFEQADDNFKYSLINLCVFLGVMFLSLLGVSSALSLGLFVFIISTGLVMLMNYLGNRDIKKFVNGLANKTVLTAPFVVLAILLSLIPYFRDNPNLPGFLFLFSLLQYNVSLLDIMFNDKFGKRIKVYIAMIYFVLVTALIGKFVESMISSAIMSFF